MSKGYQPIDNGSLDLTNPPSNFTAIQDAPKGPKPSVLSVDPQTITSISFLANSKRWLLELTCEGQVITSFVTADDKIVMFFCDRWPLDCACAKVCLVKIEKEWKEKKGVMVYEPVTS